MSKATKLGLLFGLLFGAQQSFNSSNAISQTKQDSLKTKKEVKGKTILLPLKEFYNAWSTGTTLTQYVLEVDGPLNLDLKGVFDKKPIDGYIEYADPDTVINRFKGTNPRLKKNLFKNELSKYPLLPKEIAPIFSDGKVLTKEELNRLDKLKDGKYVFTFLYRAKSKNASLPGIFVINKDGNNFNYELLSSMQEETEKEFKETREGKEKIKEPKIDVRYEKDESKQYGYKTGLEFTLGSSIIDNHKGKLNNGNLGIGTNFGGLYLGLNLSYAEISEQSPDEVIKTPRDPKTGFYGQGVNKRTRYSNYLDPSLETGFYKQIDNKGFFIKPYVGIGLGYDQVTTNLRVEEQLLNSRNEVVAQNSDNYSSKGHMLKLKGYVGVDVVLGNNFILGAYGGIRGKEGFVGAKLGFRTSSLIPFRNKDQLKK